MAIKYKEIAMDLKKKIHGRQFTSEKLPTEAALMKQYQVSRQTIRDALSLLEKEGLVRRTQGSGTYLTGCLENPSDNCIALFLPHTQEYLYPRLIADFDARLSAGGFTLKVYETYNNPAKERSLLGQLLENPPRGLLIEGCMSALPSPNLDLLESLERKGCSIVFLFNYYAGFDAPYVKDDNIQGARLLIRHLTGLGHKKIAGIFQADDLQGVERYQGYMEGLRDVGLPLPSEEILWYRTEDTTRFFLSQPNRDTSFDNHILQIISGCTAVVCYNDALANYLLRLLKKEGYRLPDDIAIVSFDNTYLSYTKELFLTSLYHKSGELADRACNTLLKKILGLPVANSSIPWELSIRESTLPEG